MSKLYLIAVLTALVSCSTATKEQEQNLHNDHTVFGVNKLQAHTDFFAYESLDLANKNVLESSTRFLSLNGDWKFHWVKSPKDRMRNFYAENLDDDDWKTIPVPANWEVEGYDYPIYLDERYPFNIKGVDRHETDPYTGHVVSKESMELDIQLHNATVLPC